MSTAKLFQFCVFILSVGMTYLVYQQDISKFNVEAEKQFDEYKRVITLQEDWQGDGAALYESLNSQFQFQFFQYIDTNDSAKNQTTGSLLSNTDKVIKHFFSKELFHTQVFAEGRLQVKLSTTQLTEPYIDQFQQKLLVIWGTFVLLSVIWLFLTFKQNQSIRFLAHHIEKLSELSFDAIDKYSLRTEFKPIGNALDKGKTELKARLDKFSKENEQLNEAVFQDPITKFGSRTSFTQHLETFTQPNKEHIGVLALIKATELSHINQLHGRTAGDAYLSGIANNIRKSLKRSSNAHCYRISAADFAIFIADIGLKDGAEFLEQLKTQLDEYQQSLGTESIAYIGLVPYQHDTDPVTLMTLADTAVSIAQTLGPNSFHILEKLTGDELFGDNRWKLAIDDLFKRRALTFYQQPIRPCHNDTESYRELLARFYNNQGEFLPTTTVIAMAQRHGMSVEIDKLVVLNTLKTLIEIPALSGLYGVNINASSAMQDSFVGWLKNILGKQQDLAARLVFEVNESGMQANLAATYQFINAMHSVGARVSIERFGLGFTSFKFFKDVRPDFIKLDGSYTRGVTVDDHNKFFIKMIIDIARKHAIKVIATSVENQEQQIAMEQLLVDGMQGYYIAKPQALTSGQDGLKTA